MNWTAASRCLLLAVIFGAVLLLPLGNLSPVSAQPPGCSHCQGSGPGPASGCGCCQQPGQPGHCGTGQGGGGSCHCSAANPAFISLPAAGSPTWQGSPYEPAMVAISSELFPLNIFHPPETSQS